MGALRVTLLSVSLDQIETWRGKAEALDRIMTCTSVDTLMTELRLIELEATDPEDR